MSTNDYEQLQAILVGAYRCLECADSTCMNSCPKHVDVRAAMRWIVNCEAASTIAWAQREDEAVQHATRAIEASFG